MTHVATLSVPGGEPLGWVAGSGPTTVVSGPSKSYVFIEPSGGWSSETPAATLSDAGVAAVSGQAIVVAPPHDPNTPGYLDVFVEPPAGWSGQVQPVAKLVASDGTDISGAGISGRVVTGTGSNGSIYVFTEPASGWTGVVHESATLNDSRGARLGGGAISGTTIVGASGSAVYGNRTDVFTEPAGGWTGTLHESARLSSPSGPISPVAISSRSIIAGFSVFSRPTTGWSGTVQPSAALVPLASGGYTFGIDQITDQTAAIGASRLGPQHQCPCSSQVWLFSQPPGGWNGTVTAQPAIGGGDSGLYKLQDPWLFTLGTSTVEVYRLTGTFGQKVLPPSIERLSLVGLPGGTPKLRFALHLPKYASPITSFMLMLPSGIAFNKAAQRSISIRGAEHYHLRIKGSRLMATFADSSGSSAVSINAGALAESKSLRNRILDILRFNRTRNGPRKRTLTLRVELRLAQLIGRPIGLAAEIHIR